MNKAIVALMVLLVMPLALAGSIDNADYYDRDTNMFWSYSQMRTISDDNVDIDADTVGGISASDITDGDSNAYDQAVAYANANDASGSNFDREGMMKYLYGEEYVSYLDNRYTQQTNFASLVFYNQAYAETLKYLIEHPNVEFNFDNAVQIKQARYMAGYLGTEQTVGNTVCQPNGNCVTN